MNATLVERLAQDFEQVERSLTIEFASQEEARALLLWICAPYLRRDASWDYAMRCAVLTLATALNDAESEDSA